MIAALIGANFMKSQSGTSKVEAAIEEKSQWKMNRKEY
jgi:hypothetical protein